MDDAHRIEWEVVSDEARLPHSDELQEPVKVLRAAHDLHSIADNGLCTLLILSALRLPIESWLVIFMD